MLLHVLHVIGLICRNSALPGVHVKTAYPMPQAANASTPYATAGKGAAGAAKKLLQGGPSLSAIAASPPRYLQMQRMIEGISV